MARFILRRTGPPNSSPRNITVRVMALRLDLTTRNNFYMKTFNVPDSEAGGLGLTRNWKTPLPVTISERRYRVLFGTTDSPWYFDFAGAGKNSQVNFYFQSIFLVLICAGRRIGEEEQATGKTEKFPGMPRAPAPQTTQVSWCRGHGHNPSHLPDAQDLRGCLWHVLTIRQMARIMIMTDEDTWSAWPVTDQDTSQFSLWTVCIECVLTLWSFLTVCATPGKGREESFMKTAQEI